MSFHANIFHPYPNNHTDINIFCVYSESKLKYNHCHYEQEVIVNLVLDIIKKNDLQEAKTEINKILQKVMECEDVICGNLQRVDQVAKYAMLKLIFERQSAKHKLIISFLKNASKQCDDAMISKALQDNPHNKMQNNNPKNGDKCVII
jgi:hypothetical protein